MWRGFLKEWLIAAARTAASQTHSMRQVLPHTAGFAALPGSGVAGRAIIQDRLYECVQASTAWHLISLVTIIFWHADC
jgi:hypothetical protein